MHKCDYHIKNLKGDIVINCSKKAYYIIDGMKYCSKHTECIEPFGGLKREIIR
jgi:hypothetical protein